MQKIFIAFLLLSFSLNGQTDNKSFEYHEVIREYNSLDSIYDEAKLITYGTTDCGEPLQLFVISKSKIFNPLEIHRLNKCVLFINNGIHAGEPDGIDASIQLSKKLLENLSNARSLENVVICIIPVFNIDGALQRTCCSRANQNGPDQYGFRGNSKNLDLNRDFMKVDSRNTFSLINILNKWDPDVFVDTHVSDGADYQYVMSLITSQHNKMNANAGRFMKETLTRELYTSMKNKNEKMCPYVQTKEGFEIPDSGIISFMETPRYAAGYVSLFHTFSFISESHMLKPFSLRKKATYNLLNSLIDLCSDHRNKIIELRTNAFKQDSSATKYFFNWKCDSTKNEIIEFEGYSAEIKKSNVTNGKRLIYNRDKPFTKKIPFFDNYFATDSSIIPKYFFLPQAYEKIASMLENSGVILNKIDKDSTATVTVFYISDYKTAAHPYEGHYLHYDVRTKEEIQKVDFKKGDYIIFLPQRNMRFIMEALIPRAVDSYFCWGFFDSFLQQKEWFSSYVFEDIAEDLLKKDISLKRDFEGWRKINPDADEWAQLYFIYQHSVYFEKTFKRYPVFAGG